jgi:hypothetical protein
MDELEQLPTVIESTLLSHTHTPVVQASSSATKKRKKPEKTPKSSKKADLVKRYLQNFDSCSETPPSDAEIKNMSIVKLETLCTIQEKQATHKLQPSGLAEQLIGFVSQILDYVAQTDNEICRLNAEDIELRKCVTEELGSLATYLNNKIKIASHVALNSGRAIIKKQKTGKENGTEKPAEGSVTKP